MTYASAARVALAGIAGAELAAAADRFEERRRLYALAQRRAAETGRRLVVIGAPDAGLHTRLLPAYGCGDVCVDLQGCPACPVSETVDLTRGQTTVADNTAVVFVSCTLEYVSDPAAAMREVQRMAGDASNVFLVTVQPWTLTGILYPAAVSHIDPLTGAARPVSGLRLAATLLTLGGLTYAALGHADR